uniref:Otopetrin-1 n=1 Tax=Schistosoma haematobium TaxID=6185 RepID=A0A094ZUJ2_SCHHA
MTASLLFMFAITQCIFGFVLPICDSFGMKGSKLYYEADHKYYLEIFLISQYCGALLVLAYLQYLIYSGTKKQLKQALIHEIYKSKTGRQLVDDKHMIINEHHELSEPNILIKSDYTNNSSPVSPIDKPSDIESTTSERQLTRLIRLYNDNNNNNQEKPYISIHPEGMNLYMRLGAVVSEVALSLKTPVPHSSTVHSHHISNLVIEKHNMTHISLNPYNGNYTQNSHYTKGDTLAGTINQHNNNNISKLCLGYLGVTLDPFLFPLAIEYSLITGSFFYKMLQRLDQTFPKSFNRTSNDSDCLALNSSSLFSPSPTSISNSINKSEFDKFFDDDISEQQQQQYHPECTKHMSYRPVMGCKVFLPLLKKNKLPILNEDYTAPIVEDNKEISDNNDNVHEKSIKFNTEHQCHRSHTGLFLGIMLLIGSIVCMVLFIIRGRNGYKQFAAYIYQKSKLTISTISLLACIIAIKQTNQLKFHRLKHGENFEYNLLTIGLIGCIIYHMFLFIPALETIIHIMIFHSNDIKDYNILYLTNDHIKYTAILYIIKCTLEICQALIQFFFIVETSRRKVCCINQSRIKPGRSIIVFLLICNLALWLINTFEVRSAETQLPLYRQYFGVRTWSVITYCFIPLIIFFRFHSTVCLAELWTKLYTLR